MTGALCREWFVDWPVMPATSALCRYTVLQGLHQNRSASYCAGNSKLSCDVAFYLMVQLYLDPTRHGSTTQAPRCLEHVVEVERLVAFLTVVSNSLGTLLGLFGVPALQDEVDDANTEDRREFHG
jgi:hypothetical protein